MYIIHNYSHEYKTRRILDLDKILLQRATTFKGRCSHCGKWEHKKVKCQEWLKLAHEEQDKADKEYSEEKPKKSVHHI